MPPSPTKKGSVTHLQHRGEAASSQLRATEKFRQLHLVLQGLESNHAPVPQQLDQLDERDRRAKASLQGGSGGGKAAEI